MQVVTWDQRTTATVPPEWQPVPYTLNTGATISCPFDGRQPYIVRPVSVSIADNIAWATKMRRDYEDYSRRVMQYSPEAATAIPGFRSGQAAVFANSVAQNGRFDYQRPPNTGLFLTFYTSFASYNFGLLGYFAGFTLDHLFEGGGLQNWLHALQYRLTHMSGARIDTSGVAGLSGLNEWCVRRAFQDAEQKLVP